MIQLYNERNCITNAYNCVSSSLSFNRRLRRCSSSNTNHHHRRYCPSLSCSASYYHYFVLPYYYYYYYYCYFYTIIRFEIVCTSVLLLLLLLRCCCIRSVVLLASFRFPVPFVFFFPSSSYSIIGHIIDGINRIITHHPCLLWLIFTTKRIIVITRRVRSVPIRLFIVSYGIFFPLFTCPSCSCSSSSSYSYSYQYYYLLLLLRIVESILNETHRCC